MLTADNQKLKSLDEEEEFEDDIEYEEEISYPFPFDPNKIRVDSKPMTIDLILKRIKYEEINLAPDFQRHADIWTEKAQSRLIESILIRIPLPAFYIDATDEDKWLVIDGLQRLNTLKKFVIDKNLKLEGLEFLQDLNAKKYDELPRNYQRRIDETILTVYLIQKGTPAKVKFNIFRRINTGGEPLSPQELRHAINPGKANKLLENLAKSTQFKKNTNLSKKREKRMDDQEFVLGFVAFCLTPYQDYPVDEGRDYFLNEAMQKINKISSREEEYIKNTFLKSMDAASKIFGENAFRKIYSNQSKKFPINKALFESWSVSLGKLCDREIQILIEHKEDLKNEFIYYIEKDPSFLKSISQAANQVKYRFSIIEKIIKELLT